MTSPTRATAVADQPSAVSGALRQPFREQVAFFRQKLGNRVPTRRWDDITAQAHDTAFMVAGAQKADLLTDLAASVDRAITEGTSLESFRKDFRAAVDKHDWHGWTGEGTTAGPARSTAPTPSPPTPPAASPSSRRRTSRCGSTGTAARTTRARSTCTCSTAWSWRRAIRSGRSSTRRATGDAAATSSARDRCGPRLQGRRPSAPCR